MKKQSLRQTAAMLFVCILLGFLGSVPVSAQGYNDVVPGDWCYGYVSDMTNRGVFGGYGDGSFRPDASISCAEFTKVLIECIEGNIYVVVDKVLYEGHWASAYMSLAYSLGIITDRDIAEGYSPDLPITRLLMTRMLVRALGIKPAQIDSPFCDSTDPYVTAAYKAYILRGYITPDGRRAANGSAHATRAEAAAIAARMVDYKADPYEFKKNAVLENARVNYLDTESELADLFYVLNRELYTEYTFYTHLPFSEWQTVYEDTNLAHFEYFYSNGYTCNYIPGNNLFTIRLEYPERMSVLKKRRDDTEAAATRIIAQIIREGMNEEEKLRAIHDYIVLNCAYDYESYTAGSIPSEAYTAYGVLCNGTAVCQGYTNAFNLLCKKAGIPCITVMGTVTGENGGDHSWNFVLRDGELHGVDTTFDDPVPDRAGVADITHFMMPIQDMKSLGYVWDEVKVNTECFY